MRRTALVWLAYAACVAVGLGVLGWFTTEMLRFERSTIEARRLAGVEENVRLALWRIDSAMAVIQGTESARAPGDYTEFKGQGTLPSPLLGRTPPFVKLHLEVQADDSLTSPQVVVGNARLIALANGVPADALDAAQRALIDVRAIAVASALRSALVPATDVDAAKDKATLLGRLGDSLGRAAPEAEAPAPARAQEMKSVMERQRRDELLAQQSTSNLAESRAANAYLANETRGKRSSLAKSEDAFAPPPPSSARPSASASAPYVAAEKREMFAGAAGEADARLADAPAETERERERDAVTLPAGPLQAVWLGNELFLTREAEIEGESRIQAVWLDWAELRAWLLARVTDLLPAASLEPVPDALPNGLGLDTRRLAFLPVRLDPGIVAVPVAVEWSPLTISLAAAWAGAGVGALALGLLLSGTLRLSERRGAFVSAVTHELRTPLTTFRMYTEMLAGGMVPDAAKRQRYLETLRTESERLSHLVENVLSYARIERGRAAGRVEETTPAALLERMRERLEQRLAQAGMQLRIAVAEVIADRPLVTDLTAVEQVLFNLVDNAAKYARTPGTPAGAIELTAATQGRKGIAFRVRDHGPGLPAEARRKLFQPFSKSAHEAAHSQPGVGLGLALCRRLAREELHGDLVLETTGPGGTAFRLEVPESPKRS